MKTDKKTLDALFERKQQAEEQFQKAEHEISLVAGEYILEILKDSYKRTGQPVMTNAEITDQLEIKEPRFDQSDKDNAYYILNFTGQAEYVINHGFPQLCGMKLIGPKEEKK